MTDVALLLDCFCVSFCFFVFLREVFVLVRKIDDSASSRLSTSVVEIQQENFTS